MQFCMRWHESNAGGGDPLVDICLTDRFSYVMLKGRRNRVRDSAEQIAGNGTLAPLWWLEQPKFEIR